jgi:hypothetical protein
MPTGTELVPVPKERNGKTSTEMFYRTSWNHLEPLWGKGTYPTCFFLLAGVMKQ